MSYSNASLAQFLSGASPTPNNMQRNAQPQFDVNQFKQGVRNMDNNFLNQLILQARQQGISEQDIQNGLSMINNLRK